MLPDIPIYAIIMITGGTSAISVFLWKCRALHGSGCVGTWQRMLCIKRLENYNYGNSNAKLNGFSNGYWGTTIMAAVMLR